MTLQEVFTIVVQHLRQQREKSMSQGIHYYHAPDGKKCSIGILIPDHEYDRNFEGMHLADIYSKVRSLQQYPIAFLYALQKIHDRYSPEQWELAYHGFACTYKLRVPQ